MLRSCQPPPQSPPLLLQLTKPNLFFLQIRLNRRPKFAYLPILPNAELGLVNGRLQRIIQVPIVEMRVIVPVKDEEFATDVLEVEDHWPATIPCGRKTLSWFGA